MGLVAAWWHQSSPPLTATGVCSEGALSPSIAALRLKRPHKEFFISESQAARAEKFMLPLSKLLSLLVLCKQSFSLSSSPCPWIIPELKNIWGFVMLPGHPFGGPLWLAHGMLHGVASGEVRGGAAGAGFVAGGCLFVRWAWSFQGFGVLLMVSWWVVWVWVFFMSVTAIYCDSVPLLCMKEPQRWPQTNQTQFLGQV